MNEPEQQIPKRQRLPTDLGRRRDLISSSNSRAAGQLDLAQEGVDRLCLLHVIGPFYTITSRESDAWSLIIWRHLSSCPSPLLGCAYPQRLAIILTHVLSGILRIHSGSDDEKRGRTHVAAVAAGRRRIPGAAKGISLVALHVLTKEIMSFHALSRPSTVLCAGIYAFAGITQSPSRCRALGAGFGAGFAPH